MSCVRAFLSCNPGRGEMKHHYEGYMKLSLLLGLIDILEELDTYIMYYTLTSLIGCVWDQEYGMLLFTYQISMGLWWPLVACILDSNYMSKGTRLLNLIRISAFLYTPLVLAMLFTNNLTLYYITYNAKFLVINLTWASIWKLLRVELGERAERSVNDPNDPASQLTSETYIELILNFVTARGDVLSQYFITILIGITFFMVTDYYQETLIIMYSNQIFLSALLFILAFLLHPSSLYKNDNKLNEPLLNANEDNEETTSLLSSISVNDMKTPRISNSALNFDKKLDLQLSPEDHSPQDSDGINNDLNNERLNERTNCLDEESEVKKSSIKEDYILPLLNRFKHFFSNPVVYHSFLHQNLVKLVENFLNGPVEILLAAKFSGNSGICDGMMYNLLYQAAITEITYLIMGPLNLRFISPLTPKIYYKFVYPVVALILGLSILSVTYNFNLYIQMTLCSIGVCVCYYANAFDYYVTFSETPSDHVGFLTSFYETMAVLVGIGPAAVLASGTDLTLTSYITLGILGFTLIQSLYLSTKLKSH